MLFYATPVLYSLNTIPDKYQWIFKLNPMAHIINGYRDIFYYQQTPNLLNLLVVGTLSILLLLIGYNVFKKLEKGFAEEV
jgi:ABC-2 type transport system permease protein